MAEPNEVMDNLGENVSEVMRASKQTPPEASAFLRSTWNWVKKAEMNEPEWGNVRGNYADNRIRDKWLMMMSRAEPHLEGVLKTAVTLDANRQYRIVGGRNQVKRFVEKFKNFEDGRGFRKLQTLNATNYYVSDIGSIVEIETDGRNGPLESLYSTDPTRFRLGQKGKLRYDTFPGTKIWNPNSYYRLVSQESTEDMHNGLGHSAISTCIKLAQIMIAVMEHDLEKLQTIAPKGIMFIQADDLTQESWDEAQKARKMVYEANTGNAYYDDILVLVDRAAKGDILALSELPERFDPFQFTDYMMKGYALAFGRPVRAFWSLNSGNFGGGTETRVQAEQATYGGAADFILWSQEQLQWLLPDSVLFEYEVEDTNGKLARAEVDKTLIDSAKGLIEIGVTPEQALEWLAEQGVIPSEWTETQIEVSENGVMKARLLETENIQRALELYPDEPIVMYQSASYEKPARTTRLWKDKRDAIGVSWLVTKQLLRQADVEDMDGDNRGDFMFTAASESYLEQNEERDDAEEAAYLLALAMLNGDEPMSEDNMNRLTGLMAVILPIAVFSSLMELRTFSDIALPEAELLRPDLWDRRLRYFANLGKVAFGDPNERLTWNFGNTIEHCSDCATFNGQTKTRAEWQEIGLVPQSTRLRVSGLQL